VEKLPFQLLQSPANNINININMSTRSTWRALHYSAKRRAFQPSNSYRCFSCATRAQEQIKPENDRMTHFGFTNVPESEKETRGKDRPIPFNCHQLANPEPN
jgi:hypothetical protein